jgi:class 3 adenylate cyclase/Tfp pilus assembly protein PilF
MPTKARPAVTLSEAERLFELRPLEALPLLERLASRGAASSRAEALALLAIHDATLGTHTGLVAAQKKLRKARALTGLTRTARARIAHAAGYAAMKHGQAGVAVEHLNEAAHDYPPADRRRAHVFDTLGMHFASEGDLERAHAYYLKSAVKKREGGAEERQGLARTYGNLGRLELAREQFAQAEHWLREDLALVLQDAPGGGAEALVRNLLGVALLGQGGRVLEARSELSRALSLAPARSVTHAYVEKDLARVALEAGELEEAHAHAQRARELATAHGYSEMRVTVRHVEGLIASRRVTVQGDGPWIAALAAFDEASLGFEALGMPAEACATYLAKAELLARFDHGEQAVALLRERALPLAERSLFQQLQPLDRIERALEKLSPEALLRVRVRRMLGAELPEHYGARLRGARLRLTVWTCDIRGFTAYCEETNDPARVVAMLNRFFSVIGLRIVDGGGRIDKYVGDNVLAYFRDAEAAADAALDAMELVERLNREREHLDERRLEIGVGLATGEVVEGNVGFAGKLEHTIIGTAVNAASRLVNVAKPGAVLVDQATRHALGKRFATKAIRGGKVALKGLGDVEVFELVGRSKGRPRTAD